MSDEKILIQQVLEQMNKVTEKLDHIDKEKQDKIKPFAYGGLIIFIASSTFGAIWWGSKLSLSVDFMTKQLESASVDRWTGNDAKSANQLLQQNLNFLHGGVKVYNDRLTSVNAKIEKFYEKQNDYNSRLLVIENNFKLNEMRQAK